MSDLLRVTEHGIHCPVGDFHIDPWLPVHRAIVTHAHSDHARPGSSAYLAAAPGLPLLRERLGGGASLQGAAYGESIRLNGVRVSLHPAGHVLGSAQVRVEHRGEVWVVTGDYKRHPDPTAHPFESVPCHILVSECTFGLPVYRWPSPDRVAGELLRWWEECREGGVTPVLFVYALGKAQRVLSMVGEAGPVLAHGAIHRMTGVYRGAGVPLPPLRHATPEAIRQHRGEALVLAPPSAAGSPWLRRFAPASTGFASGWMRVRGIRRRRGGDRGFVLSDHVDWDGILETVDDSGAGRVLLTHGTTGPMTRFLRERGLEAAALSTPFRGDDDEGEEEEGGAFGLAEDLPAEDTGGDAAGEEDPRRGVGV